MKKPEEKPTSAERIAARALGREVPVKPAGMSTAQWHVDRFNARGGQPEEPVPDVEPREPAEQPLPRWARALAYRPGGGDAA